MFIGEKWLQRGQESSRLGLFNAEINFGVMSDYLHTASKILVTTGKIHNLHFLPLVNDVKFSSWSKWQSSERHISYILY